MSETATKPLRLLCDPQRAITYGIVQPGKLHDGGTPIVRVNNFRGHRLDLSERSYVSPEIEASYARSRPRPGDILISLVGSIGQVAIASPEIVGWNLARAVGLLPMPDSHHSQWVYYALQTPDAQSFIQRHANTTVQATFNLRDLAEIPVPYPEAGRRKSALAALSALDDKIELNRRMNETLEALAQAVFKDWFVDIGPVRRKQEGATDPVAILGGVITDPEKASRLAALFPGSFGENGLPEEWEKREIGEQAQALGGSTPSTKEPTFWEPAEHWWATPKDLSSQADLALFETERRISDAGLARITSGLLPVGTVLLSSRAPIGYLAISQVPVAINQGFIALPPNESVGTTYLYLWCKANMELIVANANGSTFQEISKKNFRPIESAVPTDEGVMMAFAEIVDPLIARIVAAADENRTLAETRDYLLPKLMSGEVRVRDVEKLAE